jgi:hypothetical protein
MCTTPKLGNLNRGNSTSSATTQLIEVSARSLAPLLSSAPQCLAVHLIIRMVFYRKMADFIVGVASFVMGVVYPSYQSFKAIRTKDNKEDDTQVNEFDERKPIV